MDLSARAFLDKLAHPIFALEAGSDGEPRYCAFNRVAQEILGRPEAEILGLTAAELYRGRLGQIALDHHRSVLRSGVESTYELTLPLKSGVRRIRTTLRPELDETRKVVTLFGAAVDVTDQHAIKEMRANAETLNSELGEFVSDAALDLRRPLLRVKSIADMLRDGFQDLGDGKLELINALEGVTKDAISLISDVLSHVEATSAVSSDMDFEFVPLMKEIMALLDPQGRCMFNVTPAVVRGDRTAALIVLRNLVESARNRYRMNQAEAHLGAPSMSVSVIGAGEGFIAICLKDNAGPLDKVTLSALNGAAIRADSDRALMGVRRLILARGGRISAENSLQNDGARVRFTLPGALRPVGTKCRARKELPRPALAGQG